MNHWRKQIQRDENIAVFPKSGGRVVLNQHSQTEWFTFLNDRFNELTALPIGWDGYASRPVLFTVAKFTADLLQRLYDADLPPPSLVPGSDGTLQFEWHINQYDVEVDVQDAYNVVATRYDYETGQTEELELDTDFSGLASWVSDLKSNRMATSVTKVA